MAVPVVIVEVPAAPAAVVVPAVAVEEPAAVAKPVVAVPVTSVR